MDQLIQFVNIKEGQDIQITGKNIYCKKYDEFILLKLIVGQNIVCCVSNNKEFYEKLKYIDQNNVTVYGKIQKSKYPNKTYFPNYEIFLVNVDGPKVDPPFKIWHYTVPGPGNKYKYLYSSYGNKKGKFKVPDKKIMYKFVLNQDGSRGFKFLDNITKCHILYFDIDYKPGICDFPRDELQNIVDKIIDILTDKINKKMLYLYCEKISNSGGVHLYFPDIISNRQYTKYLVDCVRDVIKVTYKNANAIIDYASAGICMLYSGNDYYSINFDKSTYIIDKEDKMLHLETTSLKSEFIEPNFILDIE